MSVTDEIKRRLDIVDVVGGYVPLKHAGRNYKGLCPFHSEKTPSFIVFPESQNWRCFGCGRGGDVFTFVMEREGWDFPDALRYLAGLAGVELEPPTPQQAETRDQIGRLIGLLNDAAAYFHRQLLEAPQAGPARDYVVRRGLDDGTVSTFLVGYAPNSWDAASRYLTNLGYAMEEVIEAGLVVVRDDGRQYDRFRGRLMIPIRDPRGQVVGFGARALAKDAQPKYLNSPQNVVFDKSSLLFGFSEARRSIRETGTAVIVEGYMDVMQAHQAGFTNVVAQMGTALTETQLRLLARYASRLILALDPDTAGQMATERGREVIDRVSKAAAQEVSEEGQWGLDSAERDQRALITTEFDARGMVRYKGRMGFDIRVVTLPDGKDPDDLIRETPEAWASLIDEALPIVEYVIQRTLEGQDLTDPAVKARAAEEIMPLINDLANPVERSHYRQRLARLLKVDERAFFPEQRPVASGGTAVRGPGRQRAAAPPPPASAGEMQRAPTASREAFCLAALLRYPRLIYEINRILSDTLAPENLLNGTTLSDAERELPHLDSLARRLQASDFALPEHRAIFDAWLRALNQDAAEPLEYLYDVLDAVVLERVADWMSRPLEAVGRGILPARIDITEDETREKVLESLLYLREHRLSEQIQEIRYLMTDTDHGGDYLTAVQFGVTITALTKAKHWLSRAQAQIRKAGQRLPNHTAEDLR
ncbi:MAG: DNA primase [Anaerolineae bacterium]